MDFKKKASDTWNNPNNCKGDIEKRIEKALKEVWNEAIKKSVQTLEDGTESGEFYASKIRELKEK